MLKSTWLLLSFILGTLCVAVGHWSLFALFLVVVLLPVVSLAAKNVLEKRGVCFNNDRIFQNLKHSHLIEELK